MVYSDRPGMSKVVSDFYVNLFATSSPMDLERVTDALCAKVTEQDNQRLCGIFSEHDIRKAIFDMAPSKSPGPGGMTPKFFQHFWGVIGRDVSRACLSLINDKAQWSVSFNNTNGVLIPKCNHPKGMDDLRPISLCNVVYKIISKALVNRMQTVLGKCISESQSAFVPNRLISDNILVASEVLHFLRKKKTGSMGFLAAKLDFSKAYDRME